MAMWRVGMVVRMGMRVRLVHQLAGGLVAAVRQLNVDFRRPKSAAIHRLDRDPDFGQTKSLRYPEQPVGWGARGHQCSEEHVAADPRGRVQNGKASI